MNLVADKEYIELLKSINVTVLENYKLGRVDLVNTAALLVQFNEIEDLVELKNALGILKDKYPDLKYTDLDNIEKSNSIKEKLIQEIIAALIRVGKADLVQVLLQESKDDINDLVFFKEKYKEFINCLN